MELEFIGLAVFFFSVLLLLFVSLAVAGATSADKRERYWIAAACIAMQLGTITALASLLRQLTPFGWIAMQSALSVMLSLSLLHIARQPVRSLITAWRDTGEEWISVFRMNLSSRSVGTLWFICVLVVVVLSGIMQLLVPINGFDDRMYHASRVLYWIQNQTALPFITHNDRQVVFGFGSELFFLWPILFTKTEIIGRVVFWLGFPTAALSLYILARELGISKAISAAATTVWVATPIVLKYSVGLSPGSWFTVFVLGSAFWVVRSTKSPGSVDKGLFLAGLNIMIALGIQFTALALVPAVLAAPLIVLVHDQRRAITSVLGGLAVGLLASGVFLTLAPNEINYGNPFGPASMRQVHTADLSLTQIYTHTVRLPFLLLELPVVPSDGIRQELAGWGNGVIALLGADKPLPLETSQVWPGLFVYNVPQFGSRFSLAGIAWLPVLLIAFIQFMREIFRKFPIDHISSQSLLFILEAPLVGGIVYVTRWQAGAALPDRYLIAPFALAIPMCGILINQASINRRKAVIVVTAILALSSAVVSVFTVPQAFSIPKMIFQIYGPDEVGEPFTEALSHISIGSRILLVANQDARDYALFAPGSHYANQVTSWGKLPFDSGRMRAIIVNKYITHVLIQNDQSVFFHWDPPVSTVEMTNWLANQPDLVRIPLAAPGMQLYARASQAESP